MQTRVRETSIEAYKLLVESGGLASANAKVYDHLYRHGPTTQKKTERYLKDRTYTMRPRFAQLFEMGLITHVGNSTCSETNRTNMLWDVTDRKVALPVTKKKNKVKEQLGIAVKALEEYAERSPHDKNVATVALEEIDALDENWLKKWTGETNGS